MDVVILQRVQKSTVCWTVVLVTALFAAVGHLYILTSSYLQFDYYEVITVKSDVARTFPDVRICDTVRLSDYALNKYEGTISFLGYYSVIREALKALNRSIKQH